MGNKTGLATKDEVKILWKVVSKELPIPGMLKPIVNMFAPNFINGIDDKFGDRVPEPWQTYLEDLVTMVVDAVEDEKVTEEELKGLLDHCVTIMNERIDIPMLEEDTETMVFLEASKLLASIIYKAFHKSSL